MTDFTIDPNTGDYYPAGVHNTQELDAYLRQRQDDLERFFENNHRSDNQNGYNGEGFDEQQEAEEKRLLDLMNKQRKEVLSQEEKDELDSLAQLVAEKGTYVILDEAGNYELGWGK